ncbi:hypothetical protein KR009_006182 [Drosophila setifemur]|nr:hypothetical protein KR009_006182 [Drosophila setifemur]
MCRCLFPFPSIKGEFPREAKMKIQIVFTERHIVPEESIITRNKSPRVLRNKPLKDQPQEDVEMIGDGPMESESSSSSSSTINFEGQSPANADFNDFPDLGRILPDVSIREKMRLTSLNRGKLLSCQRAQQRRLMEVWQSEQEELKDPFPQSAFSMENF